MGGEVLVSLLVTRVLRDVVEVLSSDDDGSVHLGGNDGAGQDTATDGDETGEGALLVCSSSRSAIPSPSLIQRSCPSRPRRIDRVLRPSMLSTNLHDSSRFADSRKPSNSRRCFARTDVAALNGGLGGTETQTNILVPSSSALARSGALGLGLGVQEDVRLLLESTLRLDGQFGGPGATVSKTQSSSTGRYGAAPVGRTDILNYPAPERYRN